MRSLKNPVFLIAAAAITGVLAVQYLRILRPAQAREVEAACRGLKPTPQNRALGRLPTVAPEFTAQDHTGKMVHLSDFRGKVVVLRFWGSWCDTCRAEQPSLESFTRELDDDVVVLSVASDGDWEPIRKKLPDGSATLVLLDPPQDGAVGPIAQAYGVDKVPESFFIDREGIVRQYLVNKRDWRSGIASTCLRSMLD